MHGELRLMAARYMRNERAAQRLQATELVHAVYISVFSMASSRGGQGRTHLSAIAAGPMRQPLAELARRRRAKREDCGGQAKLALDEALIFAPEKSPTLFEIDKVLQRVKQVFRRQSRVVELHSFGGLTFTEIAIVEHIRSRTAEPGLQLARLWLHRELAKRH